MDRLTELVRENSCTLADGAVSGAGTVLKVLSGLVLAVVVLFFFLGGIVGAVVATPIIAAASGVFSSVRERPSGREAGAQTSSVRPTMAPPNGAVSSAIVGGTGPDPR